MEETKRIIIRGLNQNNLKNISLDIPKEKIVVFTGVSGSGKSSIVFDTIAAESQRQMNETYSAYIRGRLPKYEKPKVDLIENLSASVIIDQSRLGGNARSTVGTISDLYSAIRLLFSRIGTPYVGPASYFSFNNPNGMCMECSGLGKVMDIDLRGALDEEKSWNEGMVDLPVFRPGNWYFKQYIDSGLFDADKKLKDCSERERNLLLYGAYEKDGERVNKRVERIYNHLSRLLLKRDTSAASDVTQKRLETLISQKECPVCHGKRLNEAALSCKIKGFNIAEFCDMEFIKLRDILKEVDDPRGQTIVETLIASLSRMIDIGLPYLSMNRESASLSGGEAQRLKLVRYMGSSLTDMIYIFDEPSTGMHPRDVYRMTNLLKSLRDKGNTVLVVEHDKDVIKIADEVIDVGPLAGRNGGKILFQGSYEQLLSFSFNSKGACPACKGRGVVVTELVFMDPVTTICEQCEGNRYSEEAMSYKYKGKNIVDILKMTVDEAIEFFAENKKISTYLNSLDKVGLSYLSLGQPLSTLSGGERQRIKLAKYLNKKGNIYVLDEPTTGLHASDVKKIMKLLDNVVESGNTVIVIEHNLDVMKQADYLIDIGPDGGSAGGEVVFTGTPKEMIYNSDTITAEYLRKSCE